MSARTPGRTMFDRSKETSAIVSNNNHYSDASYHREYIPHDIAELSALPRSPEEPLTPPDSDPFKKRHPSNHQATTPTKTNFVAQDAKSQLIAEQQWQIDLLTSQRLIDRQSITRLEADRERREDYDQQRDQHRLWVIQQWANGIEKMTRLERCFEESMECERLQAEKQIADAQACENILRERNDRLLVEVARLEGVVQKYVNCEEEVQLQALAAELCTIRLKVENESLGNKVEVALRKDRESKLGYYAAVEVAEAARVGRLEAEARIEKLELSVKGLKADARRVWGLAESVLAASVMLVVLKESC